MAEFVAGAITGTLSSEDVLLVALANVAVDLALLPIRKLLDGGRPLVAKAAAVPEGGFTGTAVSLEGCRGGAGEADRRGGAAADDEWAIVFCRDADRANGVLDSSSTALRVGPKE